MIAIPRLGVLNLHSRLLPTYRGVLASFRALMQGEPQLGCTLHYITDDTIDTGPIVGTARIAVVPSRSLLWHVLALYQPGVDMLAATLHKLERGLQPTTTAQPVTEGTYHTSPTADEWAAFARCGWKVAEVSDVEAVFRRYLPQLASRLP